MNLFLRNIDRIAVKKIDEIEKEKKVSRKDILKIRPKKEGDTERDKGF